MVQTAALRTEPAAGADPTRVANVKVRAKVRAPAALDSILVKVPKREKRDSKKRLKSRLVASMKYWPKNSGKFPQLAAIQKALAVQVAAAVLAGSGLANNLRVATLKGRGKSQPWNGRMRNRKLLSPE